MEQIDSTVDKNNYGSACVLPHCKSFVKSAVHASWQNVFPIRENGIRITKAATVFDVRRDKRVGGVKSRKEC